MKIPNQQAWNPDHAPKLPVAATVVDLVVRAAKPGDPDRYLPA